MDGADVASRRRKPTQTWRGMNVNNRRRACVGRMWESLISCIYSSDESAGILPALQGLEASLRWQPRCDSRPTATVK